MTNPNFDFIADARFRHSLESDTREMDRAMESGSWKSAQVLAGSIVEALLVDYVVATNSPARPGKDPLKLDLAEAVNLCRSEGVLSDRTVDLTSVVRSFRNLIHPGRLVRLGETPPTEHSARIAVSVVNLIVEEVAQKRRSQFGLTAEQILSKVERDPASLAILRHLAADANAQQQERLVVDCIPSRYLEIQEAADRSDSFEDPQALPTLKKAYRILFETLPTESKAKAVAKFIASLREDDGDRVLNYSKAFLRSADLEHVPDTQRSIVVQHLLSRMNDGLSREVLTQVDGLPKYLESSDLDAWLDPLVRGLVAPSISDSLKSAIRKHVLESYTHTTVAQDKLIDRRLDAWIEAFNKRGNHEDAELVMSLKAEMESERLPF